MATVLPALPSTITQAINSPVALTTKGAIQALRTQQKPLTPSQHADVISLHQDYLDGLQQDLYNVQNYLAAISVVPAAAAVNPVTFDRRTITAATTITAAVLPSSTNLLLVVFVTYSTAGWHLTWDTATFSTAPTGLSSVAGAKSAIIFADDGAGKWEMCAPPMTGR